MSNVIDFDGERAHRLSIAGRACACCYDDRTAGGEDRYVHGKGWRWLCKHCLAEVDALDSRDPLGAA